MTIFIYKVFSLFWKKKLFGGLKEKIPRPYHLFSFPPSNLTHSKKVFILIFSPKFLIHFISPLNKHTLMVCLVWMKTRKTENRMENEIFYCLVEGRKQERQKIGENFLSRTTFFLSSQFGRKIRREKCWKIYFTQTPLI